jgi:hypothetical protein
MNTKTNSPAGEGSLHPLVMLLLEAGLKTHSRNLRYDREGYPGPAWHPSEVCSGSPAVCAKWVTRKWKDESGRNNMEWYGEICDSIDCDCGAEEHNRKLQECAESLNALIEHNVRDHPRPDVAHFVPSAARSTKCDTGGSWVDRSVSVLIIVLRYGFTLNYAFPQKSEKHRIW